MEGRNIPSYVLAKGISKDGFVKLLGDIKTAVIVDGLEKINDYDKMLDEVKKMDTQDDDWVSKFEKQVIESNEVINSNYKKIESLFERIFDDWEIYQKEHLDEFVENMNEGDEGE